MRSLRLALGAVRERSGASGAELYVKVGNTRRIEIDPWTTPALTDPADLQAQVSVLDERGWALRAGGASRALFLADSGPLPRPNGWSRLNRHSLRPGTLRLPAPSSEMTSRTAPSPAAGGGEHPPADEETAGLTFLHEVLRRLGERAPEARLIRGRLDSGASAAVLASTTGVTGRTARSLATVELDFAASRDGRHGHCRLYRAASNLHLLSADSIASEIAERLTMATAPAPPFLPAGEVVVSPALGCNLLALLAPLLRGRDGWRRLRQLGAGSPLGPPRLQIVDDGGLDAGWMSAAVDDEGVPTRAVALVRDGEPGEPLLSWEDDGWSGFAAAGCRRRSGWRALPELCHSHLYIAGGSEPAESIRTGIVHGCYLVDRAHDGRCLATFEPSTNGGPGRLDEGRFEVEAIGQVVRRGAVLGEAPKVRLTGSVRQLLQGIRAIGDDLRFLPAPGAVGAPTLLLTGLQVEAVG
ncbi:MAG: metallopeptidase TldD-related protein [Acidobacteriota bacterium]|nr:metallopeptidase TldD-related protein [Acidobacteriota bacterium]MDE3263382.1 metallopeptidase TldD-related protein [Acidobacteriota bacterium]